MKISKYTIVAFTLILVMQINAFAQKLDWVKTMGGAGAEFGWTIALDNSGNIISGGAFSDTLDFSLGAGTGIVVSQGAGDGFILKQDNNGNFLWIYSLGGIGDDEVYSVTTDDSGNVFVLGYITNTVDMDFGTGVYNLTSMGESDMYILKINSSGSFVWAKSMGGLGFDYANCIALDSLSNIFITGEFRNTVDFDPDAGITNATSNGFSDIFVLKLNSTGAFQWIKTVGGTASDQARSITIDAAQNVWITGRFRNSVDFNPGSGTSIFTTTGFPESFILKLRNDGSFVWAGEIQGASDNDSYGIATDQEGNSYTTGYFGQQTDFDPGSGAFFLSTTASLSDHDAYILKLDSLGNFVWALQIGDNGSAIGLAIDVDAFGNVIIIGEYDGQIDLDPGPDSSFADVIGSPKTFILKINSNGDYQWAGNSGGFDYCYGHSIACDTNNAIYFNGEFFGEVDFDFGLKQKIAPISNNNAFFVEKLIPCSAYVHSVLIGGDLTLCPGDTITLTASLAIKYFWSTEERTQAIQISDSGFYYLTVRDSDYCIGNYPGISITMDTLPQAAGLITGDSILTACVNQLGIIYTVDSVVNANFYLWSLPPLATIVAGAFTNSITVNYSAYSPSGAVVVQGSNSCGAGNAATLPIIFNAIPVTEICRATVDSLTQKIILEWQKPSESYVDGYLIFRDSSGTYLPLASVSDTVFSSYLDTSSNPSQQAEKYKIAVLDSCGNIGDLSAPFAHKTINLYGSIQLGGIAKLYWNDYVGINDSLRYFNVLRDTTGSGAFIDTLAKNISPAAFMQFTDASSAAYPLCRYVVEMLFQSNCSPSLRTMATKSTSRSNIKDKITLFDSTGVGIVDAESNLSAIQVYPNPAKENLLISNLNINSTYAINMYNITGISVMETFITAKSKIELNTINLAPGLYFLKITNVSSSSIIKIKVE